MDARNNDRPVIPTISLIFLAIALPATLAMSGCASLGMVTGQTKGTVEAMQSETAAATSYAGGKHRVVVSFNDETGNEGKVVYGATSRKINKHQSGVGPVWGHGPVWGQVFHASLAPVWQSGVKSFTITSLI